MTEPANPEQVTAPKPARTRGQPWALSLVLLLLLIMMALGGVGYWFGWPWAQAQWQRLDGIENQLAVLAAEKAQPLPDVPALARTAAEISVDNAVGKLEADWRRDLAAWQARQSAERAESTRQVSDRMSRVESQMDRLLAVDRRTRLGQEAVFLTRLAGQRLLVARDVEAALSLLQQADDLLRDTGEPRFESARLALARDRAALAAVPRVDQIGLYARLSALIEQMDSLHIAFERETPPVPQADTAGEGLWEGVSARWQAALVTLSDHLVIRRRSDEIAQLMTPEWAALARQNGQMLLEQAQIAMLSANQPLYEQSLARARDFVSVFREQDVDRVARRINEPPGCL